jgi:hypothetical protein
VFSLVLLRFAKGTRDAYHEHAFNAWTLWLKGRVIEWEIFNGEQARWGRIYRAGMLKYTPRTMMHQIEALETSWALSLRGPWVNRWREWRKGRFVTLTHGRKEVR